MNNKTIVALVGALSLFSCTSYAMAQDRAHADVKNAQGTLLELLLSVRPRKGS